MPNNNKKCVNSTRGRLRYQREESVNPTMTNQVRRGIKVCPRSIRSSRKKDRTESVIWYIEHWSKRRENGDNENKKTRIYWAAPEL